MSVATALNVSRDEIISFEKDIVEIPSWTTEEAEMAKYVHGHFQKEGIDSYLQEVVCANGNISYNVVSKIAGTGDGPSLTIFGHMDHSPILGREFPDLEGWQREPFKANIEGEWLYGKGCQDEKGGITAFVMAATSLKRGGFQPKGDVYFIPVQGHKRVSSGTIKLLESGHHTTYAINSENTGMAIVPYWVGRTEGTISVKSVELHFHRKDQHPQLLRGRRTAMEHLTEIFSALGPEIEYVEPGDWLTYEKCPELPGYPQYRFEEFHFNGLNKVALNIQVRTVPGQTDEMIKSDLERVCEYFHKQDPTFEYEVTWPVWESRPAGFTSPNSPLVQALKASHIEVVGGEPDISHLGRSGAAADGSLTHGAGITTVLYGPGGGETDKEYTLAQWEGRMPKDERIALKDLVDCTDVFNRTVVRLVG